MKKLIMASVTAVFLAACAGQPSIQSGENAETVAGGLNRIDNAIADVAYADAEADFSKYEKFVLLPLYTEDIAIVQPEFSAVERASWELDADDKVFLAVEYNKAMRRALEKEGGYILPQDEISDDTLIIMSAIIAIHPNAPRDQKTNQSARNAVYSDGPGSMTISAALVDGKSKRVIGRFVDTHTAVRTLNKASSITNRAGAREIFDYWSQAFTRRVDQVKAQ